MAGLIVRLLAVAVPIICWAQYKHDQEYADKFWDGVLRTAAAISGREFDEGATNLTDRFTLRKKGEAKAHP
ncbi:MAG: hypothetical protein AAF266_06560 [Planctomycetota bacterium]